MARLTGRVHEILRRHVQAGDVVIDATMGNGHDTLALASYVGPTGVVHAFDVQEEAVATTMKRLAEADVDNVRCHLDCHTRLLEHLDDGHRGAVAAAVFNLGYLPGGRKDRTTRADVSSAAIRTAYDCLELGGILTVLAYVEHPGGLEEAERVEAELEDLPNRVWRERPETEVVEPRLFVVQRGVAVADRRRM